MDSNASYDDLQINKAPINTTINTHEEKEDLQKSNSNLFTESNILGNQNILNNEIHDEVKTLIPASKIKTKKEKKTLKELQLERETDQDSYRKYGIGFDLNSVSINDADSPKMAALKDAIRNYLITKQAILKTNDERQNQAESSSAIHYIHQNNQHKNAPLYNSVVKRHSGLSIQDEDLLREAYNKAYQALVNYTAGKCIWFKVGRGRARLKQVKAIQDMLQAENRKYSLSELRLNLDTSLDYGYHTGSMGIFPTYLGAVRNKDYIDKRHARLRREGRNNMLHLGWYGALAKDMGNWGLAAYHVTLGTAFRALAVPTMIAANALEVVGKASKIALKGIAETVNLGFKLFRSKKRWRIKVNKHTLTHGWTGLNEARRTNLKAFKMLFVAPIIMPIKSCAHSLGRFIRNRFREAEDRKDISDIFKKNFRMVANLYKGNFSRMYRDHKINIRKFFGVDKSIEERSIMDYNSTIMDNYRDDDNDDDDE